ncbi:MAG: DUF4304 domain-containing protein [Fimbriimonadaceae bacterium]|nr:DUF4304 domain-containing protein [Fimbriimonadaceae bacterium]
MSSKLELGYYELDFRKIIHDKLRELGFRKKGIVYIREGSPIQSLAYISKSRFADIYMVDVGVSHLDLPIESPPHPIMWHWHNRLEDIVPNRKVVDETLNMEKVMPDLVRIDNIRTALDFADNVLREKWSTEDWLFEEAVTSNCYIGKAFRKFAHARLLKQGCDVDLEKIYTDSDGQAVIDSVSAKRSVKIEQIIQPQFLIFNIFRTDTWFRISVRYELRSLAWSVQFSVLADILPAWHFTTEGMGEAISRDFGSLSKNSPPVLSIVNHINRSRSICIDFSSLQQVLENGCNLLELLEKDNSIR